ncbi:uncharacterized protein BX664DRAFT_341200 [Halteromyces radiatus]|uniref:uncharacterized protein n=1 Tax=Halteromyces radiatus TaxID=101107 RepID=UPI00222118FE|nr:uncharacterized protein BX664DRAFT_341200 [Halteromyces radiatus]KAI8081752.1 hypothetical protein BX664DRAFT_341200 [Halteromyces radiatus]
MTTSTSPITQATEKSLTRGLTNNSNNSNESKVNPKQLQLELRGERIDIDRETLILFPESLTLNIISDGLSLHQLLYEPTSVPEKIHSFDFDPRCFRYIASFFEQTRQLSLKQQPEYTMPPLSVSDTNFLAEAAHRQIIILLREELDYFVLPQSSIIDKNEETLQSSQKNQVKGGMEKNMQQMKTQAGRHLVEENKVFESLVRNIEKENNLAEQHLISVLYEAGFDYQDQWAYRDLEPKRTCVMSVSLSHLNVTGSNRRADILKRLMMFWKKPARKCWWDYDHISLNDNTIRLWKRRTFWLELAMA